MRRTGVIGGIGIVRVAIYIGLRWVICLWATHGTCDHDSAGTWRCALSDIG